MTTLIPIKEVPSLIESWYGWRPHSMTVFRWTQGVHGGHHKLKTIKRGSRRLTSRGALRRFMRAWSGEDQPAISRQARGVEQRENEAAAKELRELGIEV